jgi:hypothetical protein
MPQLGTGDRNYAEAMDWRRESAIHFNVTVAPSLRIGAADSLKIRLEFMAEGLVEQAEGLASMLRTSIEDARFDEVDRIGYLLSMGVNDELGDLSSSGGDFAASRAASHINPSTYFDEVMEGVTWLDFLKKLAEQIQTEQGLRGVCNHLQEIHAMVRQSVVTIDAFSSADTVDAMRSLLSPLVKDVEPVQAMSPQGFIARRKELLYAPAEVNSCHAAWDAPDNAHELAPSLAVLAELLTNEYLHTNVRELGGAYDVHAEYDPGSRVFRMSSYSDPQVGMTFAAYEASIGWILDPGTTLKSDALSEAIICAVRHLDRHESDLEAAERARDRENCGYTDEIRAKFKSGVLACTIDDVREAASALKWSNAGLCAFVGERIELDSFETLDL